MQGSGLFIPEDRNIETLILRIAGVALVPVGILGTALLYPLASGQEALIRWQAIAISNKNAMYFMLPILVAIIGAMYYGRQKTIWGKAGVAVVTLVGIIGTAYLRIIINPLGVSP